jgi:hypothetical protein
MGMGAGEPPGGSPRILTSPPPTRVVRVLPWVAIVVVAGLATVTLRAGGEVANLLPLLPAAIWIVVGLLARFHPPRIEFRGSDLVLTSLLRTRRIPYASIKTVHGDAGRLAWSTRLYLKLQDGKRIWLPAVEAPLAEIYDLIAQHAGIDGSSHFRLRGSSAEKEHP